MSGEDGDMGGGGEVVERFDWEPREDDAPDAEEEAEEVDAENDDSEAESKPRKRRAPSSDDDEDDDSDDDDAPKAKPKKAAKPKEDDKPTSRKRKVKRGREEVEIDLDDEEGLLKLLSTPAMRRLKSDGQEHDVSDEDLEKDWELRSASKRRMREASEMTKKHKAELERLKGDKPALVDFLEDVLDVDPREVLLHYYDEDIKLQALLEQDPQRYGMEVARREQKKAEAKLKKQQAKDEAARQKAEEDKRLQRFYATLREEVKTQGIPKNDVTLGLLQRMASQATDDVTARDVVYEAKRQLAESLGQLLPSDPEALAKILGDKRLQALAKLRVKQDEEESEKNAQKKRKSAKRHDNGADALKRWELGG